MDLRLILCFLGFWLCQGKHQHGYDNKEEADIANGICRAIANKAYSLMKRVGLEPDFMMTGGVAKNPGVVRAVEEKIQSGLYICPEPEIVGAVGAALYALDTLK